MPVCEWVLLTSSPWQGVGHGANVKQTAVGAAVFGYSVGMMVGVLVGVKTGDGLSLSWRVACGLMGGEKRAVAVGCKRVCRRRAGHGLKG